MGYFDYLNDGDGGGSPRRFFSYLDEEEAARNKPPVDDRTLAAYANDTVIDAVNTGVGALKTIPDLLSPGNAVSAGAERFIASGQEKQSDYRQAARAFEAKSMADAKARGEYGIGQMLSNYADRPTGLLTDAVGNIAPTVLTGGVASAVGRAGALAQGATLAQAGATGATTGRVAAGVLGAGMGAGGTRGGYYDAIQGSPDEKLLEGSPEYRKMRETLSERDAKDALGKTITPELAAAIGISGLAEGISRATGLEALAAGRAATGGLGAALRTGAVEVGSEAATGGIQQLGQNVGVQQRLPETGLLDDVALSSVQEALIAGPGAVAAGAVEFSRPPSTMGDALLGTPDPAADANPMAVFQGATVEESIRLAADELGKATRMSDDVLMRTRDYIAQEMSTALGGIHEQALSILGAPTAPPPGFDPFAERAAQVAGQEQAERDLGAEAMAGTLKTQREAMASALKTQREAQAEEQVAQAEAVTRAQGFDAAEPTAMGLAMQRALSQTATQTEARAKAQAQVQGLGVAEPALAEPALAEPTTQTAAGQTAAGQTAAGQTAGQTAAAAEPPAADPPVRASDERLAQQNRPEDIGASSAPAAISTSSTAQEAVLGRQPAGATNSAQDPAATATTVGLTETPQAPRPAGRAQALNDALNISRKGSAVKANTYEVNIKDLPEKRTAVETGVKGATTLSRSEAETVVNFAKVFNKKVVFFRSENGVDTLDGAVVGGDNTSIYLNADASAAHHLVVAGHEIGHLMRTDAPKLYEQLTKRLSSELTGGKLANFSRYYGTDPKEVYAKLRDAEQRDALVEEYISDLIGNRVGEYRTALDLFGAAKGSKDPGLIYKVGQFVINFIDQLLAKTGFKKFTTDAMVRDLVKVRREVRTALKEYAKERQAAVATTVDEKANVAATSPLNPVPDPTPAQKEAGNYRKGRVSISGLDVSIENPAGSSRRPEWPALKDHYGYLVGTKGMDGDHIDVFVRPGMSEDYDGPVFVVDQVHPKTRKPDEHKVMLGYATKLGAVKAYMSNYEKGWGGFGSIAEMSQEEFRQWAYSGNVPALAADAKLSTARVSDVGHRREMSSGRYVGAPEWVGSSPSKLAYLRKKIRQLAVEGERGRYWYERSSKAILDLAGGDKAEAERIVSLIALYSPNTTVPANTTMALTAYYQHKAGVPIKAGFGDANRKAEELLGEGKVWSGIETNSFYQNLMVEIDPSKLDPGVATMDMWMALAFDYGMKTLDQGPKYRFAERETQRLADELGWKAHQVQAAIWVATKGRIDQIRPLLKQQELKTGIGRLVEKDGKEIYEVLPAKRKEHFRLAHKLGMAYKLSDADITASSYDFSNAIKSAQVQMSWEATPSKSKGDIPGIHSASYEQKAEYLQAVMKALTQDGRNLIADMSGLSEGSTLAGFSAWEGDVGAGAQTFLAAPAEGASTRRAVKGPARDVLNLHAALTGYVLGQDAVVWHQPVYDAAKKNHNGVDIAFARPLNEGEFQLIYRALHDQFGTWELAPAYTPRGVRVLNFVEGLDNKAFQDGVAAVVESLPADFGDSATADVTSYKSDGEYIFNDWQENPNGEGYLERIRAGRPDLQQRAADVRARVEALNRDFEKKYRWGRPDAGSRGRNRGVREGVRESAQRQDERVSYGTARDGATSVTGYHFSTESRRSLNSSAYGRGLAGEEAKRLQGADPRLSKRIYFYIDRGEGIAPEAGVGAHAHRVTLENLYDVDADALRIVRDTEGSFNNVESAIIDAGFDGYFTRQFNKSGAAVLLGSHSVTVERLGTSRGFTNTETPVAPAPQRDLNAAERIASNKALPMGQLTGLRWAEILKRSMPDTFEQFADSPVWQSNDPMYKDVLARTLARPAQVRASSQRQTDTPEFKAWFGDSKVVDENGEPLVVYHGTTADFSRFDPAKLGSNTRVSDAKKGFYFAESGKAASEFTWKNGEQIGSVMPVYLSIRNPLVVNIPGEWGPKKYDQSIDEAIASGNDGVIIRGATTLGTVGDIYIAFTPNQIKSAIGNSGAFDPANPDIRASEQRSEYLGDLDARQEAALRNVGGITPKQTLRQRMDAFGKDLGLRIRQGMVDEYASIRTVDEDAYRAARLSGATDGALEASMLYGKPFLNGNAYDVNVNDEGFAKILADLGGEHDRFLWWVAATRAKRLKLEGRENLFTDADISALESLNVGREAKFDTALRKLNEFNDAMLQIAVDSGIMDDAARQLFKNQPYVPFYRVLEDEGAVRGPTMSSGLVNQYATKKLKGGTDKLNNDLMSNLLRNWSHLLSASAKNRAATLAMDAAVPLGVVTKVPSGTKKSVRIMRLGKEEHYLIDDPHMYAAVSAIARTNPSWMKPFSAFKRWLTVGVTANPSFKIRNLIRDSLSAISQNELSYNALQNVRQGWAASAKDSQTRASMLASGGILRFGTMIEGDRGSAVDRIVKQAAGHTILNAKGFDKLAEMMRVTWETYNDLGDKSENANRAALYEQLMARGYSHADASFMARDLMDFSMSGRWEVVKFLTQSVPFLNARMQGLYKLGRASAQNPRRMGTMIAAVSLASVALMLAGLGDEDWDKREEWDRDANWWFKIGDKAFRIPKPFELGAVGTIAERTAQMFFDPKMTGKRYTDSLSHMFSQTFSLSPVPQIVKPFVDIYSNVDSFTGRPIETLGMERLRPEDRVSERTSSTARLLGQLGLPDPLKIAMGRYQPLSPVQIDSAVRGYFGWLGTTTTALLDFGMRPALGLPPRAAMQLRDAFIAGNFTESLPSGSSRYVTAMYEQARDVTQAYASLRDAQKSGDNERVREIVETERDKLSRYRAMNAATSRLSDINRNAKIIQASRAMSPQEKRRALDALAQTRDRIAQQVIQ